MGEWPTDCYDPVCGLLLCCHLVIPNYGCPPCQTMLCAWYHFFRLGTLLPVLLSTLKRSAYLRMVSIYYHTSQFLFSFPTL